jgi:hypothetical protein
MSPRFIYFLQVLTLLAMVASTILPAHPRIAAMAIGAITIERLYRPLCISLIRRIAPSGP